MAVQQWTTNPFEMSPQSSDDPSEGAARITELKETAGSLLDKEHKARDAGSVAAQGWHREGSALVSVSSAAPTTRPDATTALDAADKGRMWVDSDDGTLDYWDGAAWQDVITDQSLKTTDNVAFNDINSTGDITVGAEGTVTTPNLSVDTVLVGSLLSGATSSLNPELGAGGRAAGYTASDVQNLVEYPVGTVIIANGLGDIPNRNATANVKQAGTGAFQIGSGGTQMAGTWRARGGVITGTVHSVVLMQRTL